MAAFTCLPNVVLNRPCASREVSLGCASDADASATRSDNSAYIRPESVATPLFLRALSAVLERELSEYLREDHCLHAFMTGIQLHIIHIRMSEALVSKLQHPGFRYSC